MASRSQRGILTARGLAALAPGKWLADPAARGAGRLQARGVANGAVFYYRYTAADGTRVRVPLGPFDAKGKTGLTLDQARARAGELRTRYMSEAGDLRAALAADERAAVEIETARKSREHAETARRSGTLGYLLGLYLESLAAVGKGSVSDFRNIIVNHVQAAHPSMWAMPAVDVQTGEVLDLLSPLVQAGKRRTAAKLRSILRASFALAVRSHHDPSASAAVRALGITSNPAAATTTITGATRARDRALSVAELRAYWRRIDELSAVDPAGAELLRLHLLTGGQRVQQLARATQADWDRDARVVWLLDPKGRRNEPRRHAVPLTPDAEQALAELTRAGSGPFLFSIDGGLTAASYDVLRNRLERVVATMVNAGEASAPFTAGDLRRTVESRLAGLGIGSDVLARLLSHGLAGVQARHYNRHDYIEDGRRALAALRSLLDECAGNVTAIKRGA